MLTNRFFELHRPNKRSFFLFSRVWSGNSPKYSEEQLANILRVKFPEAKKLSVKDVSGGSGNIYEISIEDSKFKGLPIVKQHQMITDTLKNEIKDIHGIRIQTTIPE